LDDPVDPIDVCDTRCDEPDFGGVKFSRDNDDDEVPSPSTAGLLATRPIGFFSRSKGRSLPLAVCGVDGKQNELELVTCDARDVFGVSRSSLKH
jgi:hypothetical protein